jgi:cyclopropane fatty-acyl-phospholipid synthase-like methyltransferase
MRLAVRPSWVAAILVVFSIAAVPSPPPSEIPYVPTDQAIVEAMLDLAKVGPDDVVYDLGSGDGRIVITAAKDHGVRKGVGVEIDPELVRLARVTAREAGVADRVTFVRRNLFEVDLREATVVTLYVGRAANEALRPKLMAQLRPGARVVSHYFGMEEWEPDEEQVVNGRPIYLWTIPGRQAHDEARRRTAPRPP